MLIMYTCMYVHNNIMSMDRRGSGEAARAAVMGRSRTQPRHTALAARCLGQPRQAMQRSALRGGPALQPRAGLASRAHPPLPLTAPPPPLRPAANVEGSWERRGPPPPPSPGATTAFRGGLGGPEALRHCSRGGPRRMRPQPCARRDGPWDLRCAPQPLWLTSAAVAHVSRCGSRQPLWLTSAALADARSRRAPPQAASATFAAAAA
jgi:hypothetical protein